MSPSLASLFVWECTIGEITFMAALSTTHLNVDQKMRPFFFFCQPWELSLLRGREALAIVSFFPTNFIFPLFADATHNDTKKDRKRLGGMA